MKTKKIKLKKITIKCNDNEYRVSYISLPLYPFRGDIMYELNIKELCIHKGLNIIGKVFKIVKRKDNNIVYYAPYKHRGDFIR